MRLAQVFSNLLNNAAKYTDSQGQISCTVVEHEGTVEITVKDSGCGIPSDMLTEVFELFTQIDRNRARSDAGLGIGLTLVKRLVELQGGTVEAQSDGPGKGSRFVVRLPRISSGARPAFLEGQGTKNQIGKRVLVVDDNQDAANTMGAFLRMRGAEVQVAFDGEAALAAADEMHPQVVLLDLSMPGKSGYDVAGLIRQTPWGADALVIAISGHSQPEDRRHTQTSGFDHHLAKPADLTLLDRIIREG
ncbi:MAG: ATP-binding protein [bacterium]